MPPLPADSIHARACKLKCEKILTRPRPAPWTERSDAKTAGCCNLQSVVPPRRAHEYMAVRLCIEMRPLVPKGIIYPSALLEIIYLPNGILSL